MTEYRASSIKETDMVFAEYQTDQTSDPSLLFADLSSSFTKTLIEWAREKEKITVKDECPIYLLNSFLFICEIYNYLDIARYISIIKTTIVKYYKKLINMDNFVIHILFCYF
jgi:hypothetical protein